MHLAHVVSTAGRRLTLATLVVAFCITLALTISMPVSASAETGSTATTTSTTTPERQAQSHCVTDVESLSLECFSSFRAAIAAATGGQVQDAPEDAQAAALDDGFTADLNQLSVVPQAEAEVVIGIEYEDPGFRGDSLIVKAPFGCDGLPGADWQMSQVPSGWNDEISSYKVFSNCLVEHWQQPGFAGAHVGPSGDQSYIGDAMNDRTSSIRWH
jgi:hypothetical protein